MGEQNRKVTTRLGPPSAVLARSVGVACIAGGFVAGIHGLANPDSVWLNTALALIVTGLAAQSYALFCAVRRRLSAAGVEPSDRNDSSRGTGEKDGDP